MTSKADALLARMQSVRQTGGTTLWYMLFANAIADRLCETDVVTRDDMIKIFRDRIEAVKGLPEEELWVVGYEECIDRLGKYTAQNVSTNGYEATGL